MDIFNSRELALLIWIFIGLILLLIKKSFRKSLGKLLTVLFARKLVAIYCWVIFYTALVVYLLFRFNLWEYSQLKNTVVWLLTAGFLSIFDASKKKASFLKDALKDIFKITTVLEFVIGVYTFNLITEFVLVPIIIFLSLMLAFSERDKKHEPVKKLLNGILVVFGFFLVLYSFYHIVVNFRTFASTGTLSDFLIPPTLSLLFIPFVYLLSIVMGYETDFIRVNAAIKNKRLAKYARRQAMLRFRFDRSSLDRWSTLLFRTPINTKTEIDQSITMVKQLNKVKKNPPVVPFEKGWSPYKAKDFLTDLGLPAGHYNPVGDGEWFASSLHLDLKDSDLISNNISYYIGGTEGVVTELFIDLGVHDPNASESAHRKLLAFASHLYKLSMEKELPGQIKLAIVSRKSLTLTDGNRTVTVIRRDWQGHLRKGYAIDFKIQVGHEKKLED
jgi:hypothetical protein